jgi:bisphosphoglycerate-independent phosphoglycerate mutase (AlkP superfamily)
MTNTAWRSHLGLTGLPEVTPEEAGRTLAGIAASVRLTFFAHYGTDTAGHKGEMVEGVSALEMVDSFLQGVLAALPPATLLVLASDHGNLEETTRSHTKNPVFTLLVGPGARELGSRLGRITDIAGAILDFLLLPSLPWNGPA